MLIKGDLQFKRGISPKDSLGLGEMNLSADEFSHRYILEKMGFKFLEIYELVDYDYDYNEYQDTEIFDKLERGNQEIITRDAYYGGMLIEITKGDYKGTSDVIYTDQGFTLGSVMKAIEEFLSGN